MNMEKDIKFYTNQNKEAWNEAVLKHQAVSKEKLDRLFSNLGYIDINDKNLLQILEKIDIKGKDIIHLCCNNGWELMSIKNMGAKHCMGIDISELAITEAQERANNCNIDCDFMCSDVYDIPEKLYNFFDVVLLTAGCIGWIPDLEKFLKIILHLVRDKGIVVIHEIHPFSEMLPFDDDNTIENRLQIIEPYFRDEPVVENTSLDYVGGTNYDAKTRFWFVHTISSLVMALVTNGFTIDYFSEYATDISAVHKRQGELDAKIPLSFTLIGTKNLK